MHKDDLGGSEQQADDSAVPTALRRVLLMVAAGRATSRAAIARHSGLARSTVSQQVDHLLARQIIEETDIGESVRGRPPRILAISPRAGTIAVADIDSYSTQIAIADLSRLILAREVIDLPVTEGPETVLGVVTERLQAMLAMHDRDPARLRCVVAGLPGPVDFHHGRAVRPPIMPGWDSYPVGEHLHQALSCPAIVDNDVNLMALGEASQDEVDLPLLTVKIAVGIGAGIITADGEVHRGADGAAGDIGHIRTANHNDVLCQCGKTGCLEAVASYGAVLADLAILQLPTGDPRQGSLALAERVAADDPAALRRIRQAASEIGEVVAMLIHMYNPRTLVLAGPLSELHDELLSGVRSVVYERALPLATRKLIITTSELGPDAAIIGGIALATSSIFSTGGIERLLTDK